MLIKFTCFYMAITLYDNRSSYVTANIASNTSLDKYQYRKLEYLSKNKMVIQRIFSGLECKKYQRNHKLR